MKVLTICQPYAHLIVTGEMLIENRTWPTPFRGDLAIHAGKSRSWLDDDDEKRYPNLVFGAVVAVATLADCVRVEHLPPHLQGDEHANGPWCWMLTNVRALQQPVFWRGAQGLWEIPDVVIHPAAQEGSTP